ncbi:hypothetical protein SELMODRAFT_268356 [Selaginella moellendorffii]|uniref:Tetratricopeptide repeat protein 5 OB fold domain-containing protein n=1 Tax=Selaginella moellendorffii TaxID=88036 RepID=D8SB39_SELML|nr:tetratricopeptide repeat protein 5 [Selaginella moellendorffii]EFJ18326.1 hypothetical protein SELMODRAFT_268356 [Selaginella moellendorffii]|eukprot:XP_002980675.1 tetratricopeptide repeat protein 5 [Selaginella moellendorffii]
MASSLEALQPAIESLYKVRDTFFPLDAAEKRDRLERSAKELIAALDGISLECKKLPPRRALWEYFKGKVLDVMPEYCKEAEDHLSKAVKLDPSIVDAWSCLGNCFWKKGDFSSAKNCFSLGLQKGPNKKILQQLSMLERRLGKGTPNESEMVEESIKHAKEAVCLDVKDGHSWYTLGNAFLTSFFVTGAWDRQKLHQSLKAYQNAEKDVLANGNPDLYFNSAIVHQYLEDYERALRAYDAASTRDPGLPAKDEIDKIVKLLSKLEDAVANKGWIKPKKLSLLISSLATESGQFSFKRVPITLLQEGFNKGSVVYCKVLSVISHDKSVPLFYLAADSEGTCFVVSVYAIREGMMKEGNSLSLLEPLLHSVRAQRGNKVYSFKTVRIDHSQQLRVNGRTIAPQDAACSIIHAEHVPP